MSSPPPLQPINEDVPFSFKFKAPSSRVHRFNVVPSAGLASLATLITTKLGNEVAAVGGPTIVDEDGEIETSGFAISYVDDEGDLVSITSNQDLLDAVNFARRQGRDKVDLFIHDPEHPPVVEQPVVIATPAPTVKTAEEEEEAEEIRREKAERKKKAAKMAEPEPQHIPGVPNDLLLPGAVGLLAVVIVVVFVFGRSGKN